VLFDVAEAVRIAAILLLPMIPASAAEILRRVGGSADATLADASWRNEGERTILKGDALWPRIESTSGAKRSNQVSEQQPTPPAAPPPATAPAAAPAAADNRIAIDEFLKIDLRVAKVLAAEKVPNSRKLMKLSIDVGTEQRTLVAGIAEAYEPEQLVGKTVGIVFNLKPAKLMGIESNGMILAASPEGGKPVLVAFDGDIAPGSRIR
jgi:methionyl-tRNA synthetase